jgi:hypothetical protein
VIVVCRGGVRECSTSHGKVVRTRESTIPEIGADKSRLQFNYSSGTEVLTRHIQGSPWAIQS